MRRMRRNNIPTKHIPRHEKKKMAMQPMRNERRIQKEESRRTNKRNTNKRDKGKKMKGTMTQETSMKAYKEMMEKRKSRKEKVEDKIREIEEEKAPTNMEIAKGLGWSINRVTPRVLELRKEGRIEQEGTRKCEETGREAMTWRTKRKYY